MEPLISTLISVLGASGGISGLVTSWYYWKKFKKKLKIVPLESVYYSSKEIGIYDSEFKVIEVVKSKKDRRFVIETNILIINESEISTSLTDVTAFIKYSKKCIKNRNYRNSVFESSYLNRAQLPLVIKPHTSEKIKLYFQFEAELSKIERFKVARFLGWLEGKIPVAIIDEIQNEKMWEERPLEMLLVLNFDGKDTEKLKVPVVSEKTFRVDHAIPNPILVEETKRDYWEGKI